ncbi:kinase-like domain-containing protein [Xylaria bambusicola]|uniref:kinase-like domain-containing protein n=1 Tax=Xylaria bambusicola TaxID=326684 RepID=UPI0020083D71|nr:kinase-like domain-containing protein [Xylaria bambusicola]KAI0528038.1 kinase-like domain-containing protein [Xylaria bambusicola]
MQQQSPSTEQETQIVDWISKEIFSGTIVRKDLIYWYIQKVLRRDNGVQATVDPGVVDDLLSRHPDLVKRLVIPPLPSHINRTPVRLNRLEQRNEQCRREAMFGNSPPPPRQPAPYPDGDIIYQCTSRYVVRHDNKVTKYTTHPDGMGATDHPNEATVLRFIRANTTIPVPEVFSSDWDRITMEYVDGQTLKQAWSVLTPDQRSDILDQLRGYIAQLRALKGTKIGRLDGQGAVVPGIFKRSGGPFATLVEFQEWLVKPHKGLRSQSMYWHQITTHLSAECPIVFTHGDIAARNIIVRDGKIVALLDWEFSGWYPEYGEYVFALRGLDNIDWENLGLQVPSLFAKRYDLEYILTHFILSIS